MRRSSAGHLQATTTSARIGRIACVFGLAGFLVAAIPPFTPHVNVSAAAAVFVAAAISSIAGFAFSAIAAAMLMHIVDDHLQAVHIMLVASIAQQSYTMLFIWRSVRLVPLVQAVAGGLLCLPLGLFLLLHASVPIYKCALGLFLVSYCALVTFMPRRVTLPYNSFGRFVVGCFGGVTGPSTAFPGAIPTLWVSMTELPKELQRGFYQPYILVMQVAALAALAFATPGQLDRDLNLGYVVPALCGARIGLFIFQRLTTKQFAIAVRVFLFVSGLGLMIDLLPLR